MYLKNINNVKILFYFSSAVDQIDSLRRQLGTKNADARAVESKNSFFLGQNPCFDKVWFGMVWFGIVGFGFLVILGTCIKG